jgi:hypothetical protein
MIIGHGDVAKAIIDDERFLFFASGVSNSQETEKRAFQREVNLLMEQDRNRHIVYFGSLSIFYADTPYSRHKKAMEELVKSRFKAWTIVRLGNIAWGSNPNTLINFLKARIERGEPMVLQDTHRYVIELDEFHHWLAMIPEWNCEMNLTGEYLHVRQIAARILLGEL